MGGLLNDGGEFKEPRARRKKKLWKIEL